MPTADRCTATRRDGSACGSVALFGEWCIHHGHLERNQACDRYARQVEAGETVTVRLVLPRLSAPLAQLSETEKAGLWLHLEESQPLLAYEGMTA